MNVFTITIEFDELSDVADLRHALEDGAHPFHSYDARVGTGPAGNATLVVAIDAVDLWTAILIAMSLVHQSGHHPASVRATDLAACA